uniref:Uncharacterized protein n=1 Tax=Oryza glumipatula TaxID=40148 RepID=A0A0E0BH37_9ORYZ
MEDAHLLLSPKAVAASPPSPAGGGAAAKGLERRDRERRGRWMDRHAWTRKHGEVHNGGHRDAFVALATELCAPPMATRRVQSDKREKRRREEEEESAEETKKRSPNLSYSYIPPNWNEVVEVEVWYNTGCKHKFASREEKGKLGKHKLYLKLVVKSSNKTRSKLTTLERKGGSMDPGYTR